MSKSYNVEVKFGKTWAIVHTTIRQVDAIGYIHENAGESYPMRIVRIVRTVVFESK